MQCARKIGWMSASKRGLCVDGTAGFSCRPSGAGGAARLASEATPTNPKLAQTRRVGPSDLSNGELRVFMIATLKSRLHAAFHPNLERMGTKNTKRHEKEQRGPYWEGLTLLFPSCDFLCFLWPFLFLAGS